MNKDIKQTKCHELQQKINKASQQLHDIEMDQMNVLYKDLGGFIQKIYSRQKKIVRRGTNHLIDRVAFNSSN